MKVKVETAMFEVPFGSHLYGTNGPNSDLDYKVVCLPSMDTLLLNTQVTNRKVTPEGKKDGEKMLAGEAEYEYIPLQVFLNDFYAGQTYALEIAFAVLQHRFTINGMEPHNIVGAGTIEEMEDIYFMMEDLVGNFLTRNVKKMVGYAVSQSRNYGLKTERYNSLRKVSEYFDDYIKQFGTSPLNKVVLRDHPDFVAELLKLDHVKECEILNGAGGTEMAPAIEVCGKQFPLTANFAAVIKSIEGSIAQYGDRVKKYDGEGVDWKALSHAIRITEQVVELCLHGKLTFPRPNAAYLKDVKEGKVPMDDAIAYLTQCFNEVDDAIEKSKLPDRTPEMDELFVKFKLDILNKLYLNDHKEEQMRRATIDGLIVELGKYVA